MNDKMREEFFAWYLAEATQSYGECVRAQAQKNLDWVREDGSFADPMLRLAALAWQASRESLVIELPIPKELCGPDGSYMEYFEPEQIERCIEAAGLKVAP